jgi:hypothetical protein
MEVIINKRAGLSLIGIKSALASRPRGGGGRDWGRAAVVVALWRGCPRGGPGM